MQVQRVAVELGAHATHEVGPVKRRAPEAVQEQPDGGVVDQRGSMPVSQESLAQQRLVSFEGLRGGFQCLAHARRLRLRKASSPTAVTMTERATRTASEPGRKPSFMAAVASYHRHGVRSRTGSSQSMD